MDLKSDIKSVQTAHPLRKMVLRGFFISILTLLTLEFFIYFGSNIFLSGFVREKLNQSTNDVYDIGFNRLNLSLIRRGLFLDGLVMKPIQPENAKKDQVLFEFTLDEISFSGLWFDFFDKEIIVSKIRLDNPNLKFLQFDQSSPSSSSEDSDSKARSSVKILEQEIQKSIKRLMLKGFFIDQIEIQHANFFFLNFLSQGELKAENTSLLAFNLDWTTTEDWETPFNAKGFEFELQEVSFPLRDGVHSLNSEEVFISSVDKTIDIRNFSLFPDLNKEALNHYRLDLDRLRIGNVDLNKAFITSELEMDELIMDGPVIYVIKSTDPIEKNVSATDLNGLIEGHLKSITIKELSINNSSFLKENKEDSLKNKIQLDGLDFRMVGFYLGADLQKKADQFFYGQDASMKIKESKLFLGDGLHILEAKDVSVSSFKDELIVSDLSVFPIQELLTSRNPNNVIKINLPNFSLFDADLKRLYQTGELNVDQVLIQKPDIEITELSPTKFQNENLRVSELILGFLDQVSVQDFQVIDGRVKFKDNSGQGNNTIEFEQFSLVLDQLNLVPNPSIPIQDQLNIQDITLSLDEYKLKLRDNLHLILADELSIDSRKNLLEVKNLSIIPEDRNEIPSLLDKYGKTSAVDFSVPLFRAVGMDVKEALFNRNLKIREIILPKPDFFVSTYKQSEKKGTKEKLDSSEDIKDLLLGYFDRIQIDSITLDKAKIRYESFVESKMSKFEENDLTLKLKKFQLATNDSLDFSRSFFSEVLDLTFNNYSFTIAGGRYQAETDFLNYNSKAKTIEMKNLILSPGSGFKDRITLDLNLPKVNFRGVQIEDFVFDGYLNLQKLELDNGLIEIGIDKKPNLDSNLRSRRNKRLPKAVDQLSIDTIKASNSSLILNYLGQNKAQQSIKTGFDLLITEFNLDSLMLDAQDLSESYAAANLDLKDFEFAMPDSVHTIRFSSLGLGDKRDELIFSDLSIIPKDHFGKPGNPVIEAKIDQLVLQKNKLQEMFDTKVLSLQEVRLKNPVVDIYIDTSDSISVQGANKPKRENQLVDSILLNGIILENSSVSVFKKNEGKIPSLNFPSLDLRLSELGLDLLKSEQFPGVKELAKKKIAFNLSAYEYLTQDSVYRARFGKIGFEDGNLSIQDLQVRPVQGSFAYLRNKNYQTDALDGQVDYVFVRAIDPVKFFDEGLIKADEVLVLGAKIDLFRDKRVPIDSFAYKPMPQFLMEHAQVNADILSVRIRDSKIRYAEFAKKGTLPGRIVFDSVQMDMAPFYLRKKDTVYPLDKVRLGIEAKLMGSTNLKVESLLYFTRDYPMDVHVEMGQLDFSQVSDFLSKSLFVKATGQVTGGRWNFRMNEEYAVGQMELGYQGLKIQFLDSLTFEQGKGRLRLLNTVANFLAKNSNPRTASGTLIRREIFVQRDKRKFIFNSWWSATLSGIRATLGLGRAKMPKEMRKEEE